MINVNIETNPPLLVKVGEKFIYKEGQTITRGFIDLKKGACLDLPFAAFLSLERN